MISHIKTGSCLIILNPQSQPEQVSDSHPHFDFIYRTVLAVNPSPKDVELLWEYIRPIRKVQRLLPKDSEVQFLLEPSGKLTATIDDVEYDVPADLAETIQQIYEAKGDLVPFAKFLQKLAENPRKEVAKELWGFIRVCGMTLDADGNFLAYKNVNNDFTSIYDGKTRNNPGTTPEMRRQDVEHDPNRTCSKGLHFAAWGYLSHYAPGRKTVLLSISPADVVSIPTDYNNMKGRAWKYHVVREVAQPEELKGVALFE